MEYIMPPPAPKVTVVMPKTQVQDIMNSAIMEGEIPWTPTNRKWSHLRDARKAFAQACLEKKGLTIKQFKALPTQEKELIQDEIEEAFSADDDNGFYEYTKDRWMRRSVGEHDSWIRIVRVEGMAHWHVYHALIALEKGSKDSTTPPVSSHQLPPESGNSSKPPFDPVKDAALENTNKRD